MSARIPPNRENYAEAVYALASHKYPILSSKPPLLTDRVADAWMALTMQPTLWYFRKVRREGQWIVETARVSR